MLFADLQYFRVNGELVLKELAVYNSREKALSHWIFKPPFSFACLTEDEQKAVRWVERNHHQLRWTRGDVSYKELRRILADIREPCYVRGREKSLWLWQRGVEAFDMESKQPLISLSGGWHCSAHPMSAVCALRNVIALSEWQSGKCEKSTEVTSGCSVS